MEAARRRLHAFAVVTALATYLLVVGGGLGSLAGMHQMAAAVVGLLTLGLALSLSRWRALAPGLPRLGWMAVALVGAQAGLGAAGTVWQVSSAVAAVHTWVSLVVFVTVFYLAAQTADGAERRPVLAPAARRLALIAAVGVLAQALIGAAVRQAETGPSASGSSLHTLHRLGAVLAGVLLFASAIRTFRAAEGRPWLRTLALAAPVLAAGQILLGVRSVERLLDAALVQSHLAVGAALLAASWAVYLLSAPARATSSRALRLDLRAFLELTKPRITTMVVITFAGGVALAPGTLVGGRLALALVGTALIVGAANALNMYLEREVDGLMARTSHRPLPQGRLSAETVMGFGALLAALGLPLLLVGANVLTAILGVLAFVTYVWAYTPLKRRSPTALFVGAVPGALPPLMGWTAVTGGLEAPGLVLFGILFLWQIPHFLAIALYRLEEYARAGIRVMPASVGIAATRTWIVVSSVALAAVSTLPTPLGITGSWYLAVALVLGMGFVSVAVAGIWARASRAWARGVFLSSLVYLTLLFVALGLDRRGG